MTMIDVTFTCLTYVSVCLPLLIAILARRSPLSLRVVLVLAGVTSGLFAFSAHLATKSGHAEGIGIAMVPLLTAGLSAYIVITGFSCVVAYKYFRSGGPATPAMVLLAAIALGCLVFPAFVVFSTIKG